MGGDEALQEGGEQREEFLVQLLELAAADRLEEGAEQREVVGGLRGVRGGAHRPVTIVAGARAAARSREG